MAVIHVCFPELGASIKMIRLGLGIAEVVAADTPGEAGVEVDDAVDEGGPVTITEAGSLGVGCGSVCG